MSYQTSNILARSDEMRLERVGQRKQRSLFIAVSRTVRLQRVPVRSCSGGRVSRGIPRLRCW